MALRAIIGVLIAIIFSVNVSTALYEDQVGVTDWYQQYIGKVKHATFHSQKAGRRRVVVSTEENVIASLDLRRGELLWRHVLGEKDSVDQIDIAFGKYVITLSSGSILRTWNLPDGQLVWESFLPVLESPMSFFYVPTIIEVGRTDNQVFVFSGGCLHAVSIIDGAVNWRRELKDSFEIQKIIQTPNGDISAIGFSSSSQIETYQISSKNGDVLAHRTASFPGSLLKEGLLASDEIFITLDVNKSILVLINLNGEISFHQTYLSDLLEGYSGSASIQPRKFTGMFAMELDSFVALIKVENGRDLEIIEKIRHPVSISDNIFLANGQQAFAIIKHEESEVHFTVKLDTDLKVNVLEEIIKLGSQRGDVQKVFLNNYVKTDKSHGFRALIVTGDHSLILVQQGEIVWSREDGLASIVSSTSSELPLEKGVSVAKVEHSISEWIQGHLLKLKGTLMLANTEDLMAIQRIRLKSSEKTKMTRDHNGFRKLLVALTRAGKVYALHTGDGRIVWSTLLSDPCQHLVPVGIYQWQVPHHHAIDENPSVLVICRCGLHSDAPGVIFVLDAYSGKVTSHSKLPHSVHQVMPLPLVDSTEQRLHIIIDDSKKAHLYPRTPESVNAFRSKLRNFYWYSVEAEKGAIKGYSFCGNCVDPDELDFCFDSRELWSVIFPSNSEKITSTATRKHNEVVHTQAKTIGNQDVMYKYISKNMIFVATISPRAAGEIGSANPEEAILVVYIIDAVTGRIIHRLTHLGAQGPVHAVVSENWVVYHYFNLRAHKYEMSVIEVYDQSRQDNKSILKLLLGKHNLTSPVSAYSLPEIAVKSQSYFFTHSVKTMDVTSTAKGITSKQLLIGTIGDQILALDKRFLDPRRTPDPSASEREEGVIPLTDSLPVVSQAYVTHSLQVEGLRGIATMPAKLESTSLVFAYGVDLFFTRVAPSKTYDSLTEDFSYALLLITIVVLVASIFITWVLSQKKELAEKWR